MGVLAACCVIVAAAYLFDPSVHEPNALSGQVISTIEIENSKTGFRQVVVARLSNGEIVQAMMAARSIKSVPVGTNVTVYESKSLIFRKHSYQAEPLH